MPLNSEERDLIADIEALQAATRKVLRGLAAAPLDLQDGIAAALSQWVTTMSSVIKSIRATAEFRPAPKVDPGENN